MNSGFPREQTNRAYERAPLADLGKSWSRLDIRVKDNGPESHRVLVHVVVRVRVVLVIQWSSDPKVTKEYGTVIIDEEIRGFDITMNKTVGV